MSQIKCPRCGEVFVVDESGYTVIVPQLKDAEFHKNLCERVAQIEKTKETELSCAQKQRMAIAKAFIKDASVAILDKFTSTLDNKSETIVQQTIYNLMKDKTVFIISHSLSVVKEEIKEMSAHEEFLAKPDSTYASLYKTNKKKRIENENFYLLS